MKALIATLSLGFLAACSNGRTDSSVKGNSDVLPTDTRSYCGSVDRLSFDNGAPVEILVLTYRDGQTNRSVALFGADDTVNTALEALQVPLAANDEFCALSNAIPEAWTFGKRLSIIGFTVTPFLPSDSAVTAPGAAAASCQAAGSTVQTLDSLRSAELPYQIVKGEMIATLEADGCVASICDGAYIEATAIALLNAQNAAHSTNAIVRTGTDACLPQ